MAANMSISDLLSSLTAGKRPDVFLSVTPGVGLEMIQIDYNAGELQSYALRPIQYNESLRELTDMEGFKTAVSEMFTELNINPKCNITLNLPTVLFGSMDINLMLGEENITGAAMSEVEQSYVFKRHDPMVKWFDSNTGSTENRKIFYSAVQQLVVENIGAALGELGAQLVSVEMSLLSTLRALDFTGLAAEEMKNGVTWNVLTVNATGYTILSLSGKNIIDYYEEPLPVNSYQGDEIYNAISASAQISLMSLPANYLMVISDTSSVSAEMLAKNLNVDYTIEYVENNQFKRKGFINASLNVLPENASKASLQAIGCAIAKSSDYPIRCDFLATSNVEIRTAESTVTIPIGEDVIEVSPRTAQIVAGVIAVILIAIAGVLCLVFPPIRNDLQTELDTMNTEIAKIDKEIKKIEEEMQMADKFSVKKAMGDVLKDNRAKLIAYSAIGEAVPNNLWLTFFETTGKGSITVKGGAATVEDVYTFYRNLKESTNASGLQLKQLEMQADNVDDFMANMPVTYDFEISNAVAAPKPVVEEDTTGKKGKNSASGGKNKKKGKATGKAANIKSGDAPEKLLSDTPLN